LYNGLASLLRLKGILVLGYLDDFPLAHQNAVTLERQLNYAVNLLQDLDWMINFGKSLMGRSGFVSLVTPLGRLFTRRLQRYQKIKPTEKEISFTKGCHGRLLLVVDKALTVSGKIFDFFCRSQ
jgi:hypothetical protein